MHNSYAQQFIYTPKITFLKLSYSVSAVPIIPTDTDYKWLF